VDLGWRSFHYTGAPMMPTIAQAEMFYTEPKITEECKKPNLPASDPHVYEGFSGLPQTMRRVVPQK
jgi:hypothetical protein